MTGLERLSAADLDPDDAAWWEAPAPVERRPDLRAEARARTGFTAALSRLELDAAALSRHAPGTTDRAGRLADMQSTVEAAARLAELRRQLARTEAWLLRAAAHTSRDHDLPREGMLADGRRWEVKRAQDRKAWDHPRWQADARMQVLSGLPGEVVNPDTGEAVDLWKLLEGIEAVHGSGPPRVGQLKALGLDPGDYCETVPGAWGLRLSDPDAAPAGD